MENPRRSLKTEQNQDDVLTAAVCSWVGGSPSFWRWYALHHKLCGDFDHRSALTPLKLMVSAWLRSVAERTQQYCCTPKGFVLPCASAKTSDVHNQSRWWTTTWFFGTKDGKILRVSGSKLENFLSSLFPTPWVWLLYPADKTPQHTPATHRIYALAKVTMRHRKKTSTSNANET